MSKLMPLVILAVMVMLLIVSWNNVAKYNTNIKAQYDRHIKSAQAFESKEIYIDAVKEYEAALNLDPTNYDVANNIIILYEKLEDNSSYLSACQKAKNVDPSQLDPYLRIADFYFNEQNLKQAYAILKEAEKVFPDNEVIKNKLIQIKGKYVLAGRSYQEVRGWCYEEDEDIGYAVIKQQDLYGLLSSENEIFIECEYEEIGPYMGEVIPVKKNGEYYYITEEGYRKIVPDRAAQYLGPFANEFAAAKIDGVYGYIDKDATEYHFEYEFTGSFANNIAAVKKNGKWSIIDTSFDTVNNLEFDDILLDEYGFCSTYGVFFGKQGGKYYLYNTSGEKLSEGFEDAKLFASDEAAAIKLNGKWGYVSKTGEIVLEPSYEDANSFSLGYGPFLKDGKWGCIDSQGTVIIEPTFDELSSFYRNGFADVVIEGVSNFALVKIYE